MKLDIITHNKFFADKKIGAQEVKLFLFGEIDGFSKEQHFFMRMVVNKNLYSDVFGDQWKDAGFQKKLLAEGSLALMIDKKRDEISGKKLIDLESRVYDEKIRYRTHITYLSEIQKLKPKKRAKEMWSGTEIVLSESVDNGGFFKLDSNMAQSPDLGDLYPEEKILIETHLATDEQEILKQIHQNKEELNQQILSSIALIA